MDHSRRRAVGLVGLGVIGVASGAASVGALAGRPRESRTAVADPELVAVDSALFALRSAPPGWADERAGEVAVIANRRREGDVLWPFAEDVPEDRWPELRSFGRDIDYDTERLVLVEAVGRNACYDAIEIRDVRVDDGRLAVAAAVSDAGREDVVCAQALVFPSVLVRATFADDPVDGVAVELTDSWGETSILTADTDEPASEDSR